MSRQLSNNKNVTPIIHSVVLMQAIWLFANGLLSIMKFRHIIIEALGLMGLTISKHLQHPLQ